MLSGDVTIDDGTLQAGDRIPRHDPAFAVLGRPRRLRGCGARRGKRGVGMEISRVLIMYSEFFFWVTGKVRLLFFMCAGEHRVQE